MVHKIGFAMETQETKQKDTVPTVIKSEQIPKKSVVQVRFPGKGMALAYYNDRFDLHAGDFVYVDGKLEGQQGQVTEVNYNFKIKISDYQRVIAVVDTDVHGQFHKAATHFVTFERNALPYSKAATWFKAPINEEDVIVSGSDETAFSMKDPHSLPFSAAVAERGHTYYMDNRVKYISIDGTKGNAIVEGSENYEVEFCYKDGQISNLVCSCFCSFNCKHEFAALLQLKETLDIVEKHYAEAYAESDYFAAVEIGTLLTYAINPNETASVTL